MKPDTQKYKQFGADLACIMHGVDPYDLDLKKEANEYSERDTVTKACVCKMAADMYEGCGKTDRPEYFVFRKLARAADWPDPLDTFYDSVLTGLGTFVSRSDAEFAQEGKAAGVGVMGGLIPSLVGKGLALTPSMLATLAGLGVGVGAAGGAVSWKMNRDSDKDEAGLEAMKARIKYYNQITDEISRDLEEKGDIGPEDVDKYEQNESI